MKVKHWDIVLSCISFSRQLLLCLQSGAPSLTQPCTSTPAISLILSYFYGHAAGCMASLSHYIADVKFALLWRKINVLGWCKHQRRFATSCEGATFRWCRSEMVCRGTSTLLGNLFCVISRDFRFTRALQNATEDSSLCLLVLCYTACAPNTGVSSAYNVSAATRWLRWRNTNLYVLRLPSCSLHPAGRSWWCWSCY